MRVHLDTYPTRLTSFIAQTPSGIPQWFDWDDAATPRTDAPVRFRFYWSRHNAWQGFPDTYRVPRIRP